ncbi:barstar family protein [Streptomyces sp. Je 1-79]|uniref:barstar family protein n=1 Tax=Streptomyces sp. Je 1-79 TaxID=2943847 RepID=UPI0021A408FB|nr:barstar family protein [Streptomyces sp. Je 1-79]MCT4357476.1 barstar family protein [Streptomyces sp. Je 1-79]
MTLDDALVLDLSGIVDKAGFMDRCAAALGLPGWFGRNWDALADCLTDLPGPVAVVVTGWQGYAEARPRDWETARDVFATASDTSPTGLTVLLALGGNDKTGAASLG